MHAVTEVTNEQYKEPAGSRLFEVWESGLTKPPSVAIRSLHNVVNRYLRVTRPEEAEDVSNGNVYIIVYLARHDNEEIFPQDIEQRFGVTRSTSCRVLGLMEQKGLIARWLANNHEVLILDEPTRVIDVGAKYEIYCIIADLAKQGKSIIMISSEMSEIIGMSNRVMVMCDGRITGFINGKDATQENIMALATQFETAPDTAAANQ